MHLLDKRGLTRGTQIRTATDVAQMCHAAPQGLAKNSSRGHSAGQTGGGVSTMGLDPRAPACKLGLTGPSQHHGERANPPATLANSQGGYGQATGSVYATSAPAPTRRCFNGAACYGSQNGACAQMPVAVQMGGFPAIVAVDRTTGPSTERIPTMAKVLLRLPCMVLLTARGRMRAVRTAERSTLGQGRPTSDSHTSKVRAGPTTD